jgi:hypothetical protein
MRLLLCGFGFKVDAAILTGKKFIGMDKKPDNMDIWPVSGRHGPRKAPGCPGWGYMDISGDKPG